MHPCGAHYDRRSRARSGALCRRKRNRPASSCWPVDDRNRLRRLWTGRSGHATAVSDRGRVTPLVHCSRSPVIGRAVENIERTVSIHLLAPHTNMQRPTHQTQFLQIRNTGRRPGHVASGCAGGAQASHPALSCWIDGNSSATALMLLPVGVAAVGGRLSAAHSSCGVRTTTMPATLPGMFDAKASSSNSPVMIART